MEPQETAKDPATVPVSTHLIALKSRGTNVHEARAERPIAEKVQENNAVPFIREFERGSTTIEEATNKRITALDMNRPFRDKSGKQTVRLTDREHALMTLMEGNYDPKLGLIQFSQSERLPADCWCEKVKEMGGTHCSVYFNRNKHAYQAYTAGPSARLVALRHLESGVMNLLPKKKEQAQAVLARKGRGPGRGGKALRRSRLFFRSLEES